MHLKIMILMKIAGVKHTLKSVLFKESVCQKTDSRLFGIILDVICCTSSSAKSLYT